MTTANILAGATIAFFVSAALSFALARSKWSFWPRDTPNDRSLHTTPTPRSGGLAILLGLVTALLVTQGLPGSPGIWICAATGLLAIVSFADDRKGLPVGVRFVAHALAAGAAVWGAGLAAPRVWLPFFGDVALGALAAPLSFLGILWLTNLYNFMDGADGLAGGMTMIGGIFLGMALSRPEPHALAATSFTLAAAAGGFLMQNFPPAKLFLGDVGSVTTGFLFGVLALNGATTNRLDPLVPIIIFAPFILDATTTLLQRALRGDRVWEAHRSHYYQRLILSWRSHRDLLILEYTLMAASGGLALLYRAGNSTLRTLIIAAVLAAAFSVHVVVKKAGTADA